MDTAREYTYEHRHVAVTLRATPTDDSEWKIEHTEVRAFPGNREPRALVLGIIRPSLVTTGLVFQPQVGWLTSATGRMPWGIIREVAYELADQYADGTLEVAIDHTDASLYQPSDYSGLTLADLSEIIIALQAMPVTDQRLAVLARVNVARHQFDRSKMFQAHGAVVQRDKSTNPTL